ncbi:hypothetical protein ScPMuIL_003032 [Solemya velum]
MAPCGSQWLPMAAYKVKAENYSTKSLLKEMLSEHGYQMFILVLLFAMISAHLPGYCRDKYKICLAEKIELHCKLEQLDCFRLYCIRNSKAAKTPKREVASKLACFVKYGILVLIPDA